MPQVFRPTRVSHLWQINFHLSGTYFSRGWPGEAMASLCNLAVTRVRSASVCAEARRLRRVVILC